MIRHRRLPSPAFLVALAALFVALSAGAYAASKLPANSVGEKQIKNGAVTSAKIERSSALAKAWGRVNYLNANDPEPSVSRPSSSGIAVTEAAEDGGPDLDGVSCVAIKPAFDVVTATANDAAGAASPTAYVSVNYSPSSGGIECPANADVRISTFTAASGSQPSSASYSLVAH